MIPEHILGKNGSNIDGGVGSVRGEIVDSLRKSVNKCFDGVKVVGRAE